MAECGCECQRHPDRRCDCFCVQHDEDPDLAEMPCPREKPHGAHKWNGYPIDPSWYKCPGRSLSPAFRAEYDDVEQRYLPIRNVGGADPVPSDPAEWDEALHVAAQIARGEVLIECMQCDREVPKKQWDPVSGKCGACLWGDD